MVFVPYRSSGAGTFCPRFARSVTSSLRGRGGLATSALVMGVLVLAFVLGMAYYTTASAEAHEEHRRMLGEQAALLTQNMVAETYYALFTRLNSPGESGRYDPDVYARSRSLKDGQSFTATMPSLLAWRTAPNGFKLKPVEFRIVREKTTTEQRVTYSLQSNAVIPAGVPPPAGVRRRSCYRQARWVPEIKWQRVARGKLHIIAAAQITGSELTPISRTREAVFPFRIIEVSTRPRVNYFEMIPIQDYQVVERGGEK
jgi:hypothetical protein